MKIALSEGYFEWDKTCNIEQESFSDAKFNSLLSQGEPMLHHYKPTKFLKRDPSLIEADSRSKIKMT